MEVPKTVCEYEDGHVEESVEEGVEDSGEEGEEVAEEETEEEEAPAPVVDSDISNWFVKPSPQFYYPQYQQQQYAYYGK